MIDSSIESVLREMKKIDPSKEYYAITLLANESGKIVWETQSNFCGLVDNELKRELRVASLVIPENMADAWQTIGQDYLVVKNKTHLYIFFHLGGNALVEKSIVQESSCLREVLEPVEVIRSGYAGFKPTESFPNSAFNKAPTPKHRMKIIKRDNYRCAICGRSPKSNSDIELHVHHIRPFGKGGMTEDENLITLCHTCHNGLHPHADLALFSYVNGGELIDLKRTNREYLEGVKRYRELFKKAKPQKLFNG